jgi:Uma2 family endonuclease
MQLTLEQIIVSPGQQLLLKNITWQQFETLLEELGESRAARLSYSNGILEIMVPLPEHEKDKEIIGELVRILLDALQINFEPLGSTTFKNVAMSQAVEADTCFYIQNYRAVIGKDRIDLTIDPPPDLAIEIDLTSRTQLDNYRLLGVPELWRYTRQGLQISLLDNGTYLDSKISPNFLGIPIVEIIDRYVNLNRTLGRNKTIKEFKQWIQEHLETTIN